jgi:hypothetical protein
LIRRGEDGQPDQATHQRTVDAHVLKIFANLKLYPVDECLGVPSRDHSRNERANLIAACHQTR